MSEVIQHRDLPELNLLLCGRRPSIYSARDAPGRSIAPPAAPPATSRPRFAPVSAGAVPHAERGPRNLAHQSRLLAQVREDADRVATAESTLRAYAIAHQIKATVHERDFDDHFSIPLQRRIAEQMEERNYRPFVRRKQRLIREMDEHPVPIRSPRRLPPLARIRVSQHGLRDPKNRYKEQQAIEERLERVVNEANGVQLHQKRMPGVKSLEYRKYSVLSQTRFFFGNDPDRGNRSGRKVFQEPWMSRVGEAISSFDLPGRFMIGN
jgi:hypothetical protein